MSQTTPSGAQVDFDEILSNVVPCYGTDITHDDIEAARTAVAALIAERDAWRRQAERSETFAASLAAENKAMRQTLEELTCAVAPMLEAEVCCEPITVVDPDPTARHGSVSTWSPYPLMSFRQEDMWELKRMHGIATAALARTPAKGNDDG